MPDPAGPAPGTPTPASRVLRDRAGMSEFITQLAEGAQREIVAFAPQLDPTLFDSVSFVRALARFAARHRHNRARILVEDAAQAIRDNDNLISLCRKLGEYIQLRRVDEAHIGLRELFVVADRRSYLHQEDLARLECVADPAGKQAAVRLALRFEQMWDRSHVPEGLHTPGLA